MPSSRRGSRRPAANTSTCAKRSAGLAPGAVTDTVLVKSNLGYTGSDQTRQEMLQNSQFVDARAEFSAKYGSIQWARLAEFPVTRTLISN